MAADIATDAEFSVVSDVSNGVSVWYQGEKEARYNWSHQGDGENLVTTVHIAADNNYVLTSDREAFALWDVASGEPMGFWRIDESSVRDVAVASSAAGILVGRGNGKVLFFEPDSGRRIEFLGHQEKINSVDISPNGRFALTGGNDYVAYLWSTRSGQVIHRFSHPSRVTKVALDDKGRFAFTADSQKQARVWNVQTGEPISTLKFIERQKIFTDVEFSADGKYLLTGSPSRGLSLWDLHSGEQIQEWRVTPREGASPRTAVVYGVSFLPDNRVLSVSSSGLAEVWEINSEQ